MYLSLNIYYTIISKCQKFAKKSKMVRSSKKKASQIADILLHACMNFENYPMKTVAEDTFYSYYILYHYFKISKTRQKYENWSDRQ